MNKRVYIVILLAFIIIALTVYRETANKKKDVESLSQIVPENKPEISGERIFQMADTTLHLFGIKKENIRPVKNKNDVRVFYPEKFDVLRFVGVMKDSLQNYNANIFSVDNAKEKRSVVQIKTGDKILKSFIFSKEQITVATKGVTSSVKKRIKRR